MSLKRKTKLEHYSTSRGQVLRQINNEIFVEEKQLQMNEKENDAKLLEKMYEKMERIMKAYAVLEEECRRKDGVIKELENENLMLKQRIVQKSQLGESRLSKSRSNNPPKEGVVIQRTFTPIDIKKQPTQPIQTFIRPSQTYNHTANIIHQNKPKLPLTKLLRQSKSVEQLSKTTRLLPTEHQHFRKMTIQVSKIQQTPIFAAQKLNQNKFSSRLLQDDKTFLDVLSKLKEKIKKFDQEDVEIPKNSERETLQKLLNIIPPQESMLNDYQPLTLSKAKSSKNLAGKSHMKQSRHKQEMQELKKIWDQRDNQIKRMDDLFSKIDQRINMA